MNRHTRRILEKKLGSDFPLMEFCALAGYYKYNLDLNPDEFMVYLLKKYIPLLYAEKRELIENTEICDC